MGDLKWRDMKIKNKMFLICKEALPLYIEVISLYSQGKEIEVERGTWDTDTSTDHTHIVVMKKKVSMVNE